MESRPRLTRKSVIGECVLETNPSISKRVFACASSVSHCSVQYVFLAGILHSFHLQRIQLLLNDDHPARVSFPKWYFQRVPKMWISQLIIFSQMSSFSIVMAYSISTMRICGLTRTLKHHARQHIITVNVWAGLVANCLVGPPSCMIDAKYLIFLEKSTLFIWRWSKKCETQPIVRT